MASKIEGKKFNQYELDYFRDIVDAIFATNDRAIAEQLVKDYSNYWMAIPGTRGATGKRTMNVSTTFANLFDVSEPDVVQLEEDETIQDESKLDELEESVKRLCRMKDIVQ